MATNAPNYVSLTSDNYDTQLADILRRQKYAELLAQQGNEDIKVENVNGVPTPISPFQGLAKVFQTGMGAYLGGKAAEDAAALKKSERSQLIENLKNYETAPGDTISMPEQSISANMPAIPRATFDRATGTLVPGADTQTTPTNINIPKYELAAASRPRTLTEKGDLALQYAQNGSPETSAMWTGRYADVAKKQQLLANLVPQAKAALINKATPPNLLPSIQTALDLQDVEGLSADLKLAKEKGTASAKDQLYINASTDYLAKHPGKDITDFDASAEGKKAGAEAAARLSSQEKLAAFTKGLGDQDRSWVTIADKNGKPQRAYLSKAEILAKQNAGVSVSDVTVKPKPRLTSQQFIKLGEQLTGDVNTANRLKDYMKSVGNSPQGFKLIAQDFANAVTTAFGNPLTAKALQIATQNGTLQQLIGNLRLETVGGGVMTEQDAVRVITALGGNVSAFRNKQVVQQQIENILRSKEARIKQDMQFYNRDADAQDVAPMEYNFGGAGKGGGTTKTGVAFKIVGP